MGIRGPPPLISEMKKADLMASLGERPGLDPVSQSYTFPGGAAAAASRLCISGSTRNEVGRVWRPDLGILQAARTRWRRRCW